MPTKAKALVCEGPGEPFKLVDIVVEDPGPGEVLVKMTASGICHSDLAMQSGQLTDDVRWPVILGHEGAGIVHAIGEGVTEVEVGDSVILAHTHCGSCRLCKKHGAAACEHWYELNFGMGRPDGSTKSASSEQHPSIAAKYMGQSSFASFALVSPRSCHKVPKETDLVLSAPLGCGTMTGAATVSNLLRPERGQPLGVWGMGGVGVASLCAAKVAGCNPLIAVDIDDGRLEFAKECGATHVVNGRGDVAAEIARITGGQGLDFAVEATGVPSCISSAWDSLGRYGTLCQVGAPPLGSFPPINLTTLVIHQKKYIGSLAGDCDPGEYIPKLLDWVADGTIPLAKMSKTFPLADFEKALAAMKDGSVIKPVLIFD